MEYIRGNTIIYFHHCAKNIFKMFITILIIILREVFVTAGKRREIAESDNSASPPRHKYRQKDAYINIYISFNCFFLFLPIQVALDFTYMND